MACVADDDVASVDFSGVDDLGSACFADDAVPDVDAFFTVDALVYFFFVGGCAAAGGVSLSQKKRLPRLPSLTLRLVLAGALLLLYGELLAVEDG